VPKQNPIEPSRTDLLNNINLVPARAHLPPTVHVERRDLAAREMLLRRIRGEFEEMPGLAVTLEQATRLFGVSLEAGLRIMGGLTEQGVLCLTADRRYALRPMGE
jgi:hypothetical protein